MQVACSGGDIVSYETHMCLALHLWGAAQSLTVNKHREQQTVIVHQCMPVELL